MIQDAAQTSPPPRLLGRQDASVRLTPRLLAMHVHMNRELEEEVQLLPAHLTLTARGRPLLVASPR